MVSAWVARRDAQNASKRLSKVAMSSCRSSGGADRAHVLRPEIDERKRFRA